MPICRSSQRSNRPSEPKVRSASSATDAKTRKMASTTPVEVIASLRPRVTCTHLSRATWNSSFPSSVAAADVAMAWSCALALAESAPPRRSSNTRARSTSAERLAGACGAPGGGGAWSAGSAPMARASPATPAAPPRATTATAATRGAAAIDEGEAADATEAPEAVAGAGRGGAEAAEEDDEDAEWAEISSRIPASASCMSPGKDALSIGSDGNPACLSQRPRFCRKGCCCFCCCFCCIGFGCCRVSPVSGSCRFSFCCLC
mmetsp:Transcript_21544/g.73872  ORF Transcript_21544/g.73872 Transcript_21544/m.73872 type:complete len:261 (+) Transcript_21544:3461-4243(+)